MQSSVAGPPLQSSVRRSTWPGKPSAAGAVNYLASVGTILLLPYNTIVLLRPAPAPSHSATQGAHYYTAPRTDLLPGHSQMVPAAPHDPPPYNAQPLQPSCKPLTTPHSSLPTTHVIPSDPQTSPLTLSSIEHLSNSHPRVPWTGLRKQQLPPGGSPVGQLDLNLGFAPSALYSANTGD